MHDTQQRSIRLNLDKILAGEQPLIMLLPRRARWFLSAHVTDFCPVCGHRSCGFPWLAP